MNVLGELAPLHLGTSYVARMARDEADLRACQSLRFVVFNSELNEGLASSFETCLDRDLFDSVCDHLLVEHSPSGEIVGTYRMQSGATAHAQHGYYCAQEFVFDVYAPLRAQIIELGRACIAREHRNFQVLSLLWRGIAAYAQQHGGRYLIGCSSLTSQNPADGVAGFAQLQHYLAPPALRTVPTSAYVCPINGPANPELQLPKLLSAYLALGAWICGPPALDREFKTIDFLTLIDLQSPDMQQRRRRFGIL